MPGGKQSTYLLFLYVTYLFMAGALMTSLCMNTLKEILMSLTPFC